MQPAKSQGVVVRFTVLTEISRTHGMTQNAHGKLISDFEFLSSLS